MVRNNSLTVSRGLLDLTVSACDLIRTVVDNPETELSQFKKKSGELAKSFKKISYGFGDEDSADSNAESLAEQEKEEAYELLNELESSLLELEKEPNDKEIIDRAFRSLHTIKGSGSMSAFIGFSDFLHDVETVFDMVRNDDLAVTGQLTDLTLLVCDLTRTMLDNPDQGNDIFKERSPQIITSLKGLISGVSAEGYQLHSVQQESSITYRIRFRPSQDILKKGTNPLVLLDELNTLGYCTIIAQKDQIPGLEDINPENCYTYWDIILTTEKDINEIRDIFIFVENDSELTIDAIDDSGKLGDNSGNDEMADLFSKNGFMTRDEFAKMTSPRHLLGEILVERGDLTHEDLDKVLGKKPETTDASAGNDHKPIGERLVNAEVVDTGKIESALAEQKHVKTVQQKKSINSQVSSIRVTSDKLDKLVDLVGEMVTVQAQLTQTSISRSDPELIMIAEEVERLTEELRDNTMSVRLVPIGTLFGKFKRLGRDISKETGKLVEMSTEGAETELDKTVIERLNDPLVHLIRNSIDHGIEAPSVRKELGKPEHGTIHLSAMQSGGNVLIKIRDDGKGIDAKAVREKAIAKGLLESDKSIPDKEIFSFILAPGFTTAEKITNVSGRGVGMDVVKRNIDDLRGSLEINSTKDKGSTITLKLPLTLAIIDGLLVRVGESFFVIPLAFVEECVELLHDERKRGHDRHIANVRGEIVPYISLREQFMIHENRPAMEQIVITEIDGVKVGFVVDQVVDEHQTVIKSLGKAYQHVEGISGATILGDGTLALILDAAKLLQIVEEQDNGFINNKNSDILIGSN
jgi:two-component system chemotaxis sensor kinase CheA